MNVTPIWSRPLKRGPAAVGWFRCGHALTHWHRPTTDLGRRPYQYGPRSSRKCELAHTSRKNLIFRITRINRPSSDFGLVRCQDRSVRQAPRRPSHPGTQPSVSGNSKVARDMIEARNARASVSCRRCAYYLAIGRTATSPRVKHEQRMATRAARMATPGIAFVLARGAALARFVSTR